MDWILHDHCYTSFQQGGNSPDGTQIEVKQKRKSLRDTSQSSNNDLIDGLPDGYVCNSVDVNNHPEESNHSSSSAKRKLSLSDSPSSGSSPKSRKGNKIHELLFGECDDPQYVDGVQIPDTQTVASDEGKSITTSDFGLYINNPSTYSSMSAEDTRAFLSGPERLAIFGTSMSVDSETEILEAASTLMDLARNSGISRLEHKPFKKNKSKADKVKRNNILKTKPTTDIKTQKRKYTKRKGSKKDNVKETYSLWTNGNKYDEFEYYATKPLHRSQCTLSSRKSSYRRSNEKRKDSENLKVNGEVNEDNEEETIENFTDTKVSEMKPQIKQKRKNRIVKSKPNKADNDLNTSWEDFDKKSPIQVKKSPLTTPIKNEPKNETAKIPPLDSPIASSSAMTLPELDIKEEHAEDDMEAENGVDSDADLESASKLVLPQAVSLTRPIHRRGKRKSFGSDDDQMNSDDDIDYKPIKFEACQDEEEARIDPWGHALPPHILTTIFEIVVGEEGVAPFLAR